MYPHFLHRRLRIFTVSKGKTLLTSVFSHLHFGQFIKSKEILKHLEAKGYKFDYNKIIRILTNKKYTGINFWGGIEVPNSIPMLINDTLFLQVQKMVKKSKHAPAKDGGKIRYLLSGKAFCGHCENNLVGESGKSGTGKIYNYYKCYNQKKYKNCDKKPVSKDWLENIVVTETIEKVLQDDVIDYISEQVILLQAKEADYGEIKAIEAEIKETDKKIKNLLEAIANGGSTPSAINMLNKFEEKKVQLEIFKSQANIKLPQFTKEQVVFWLSKFKNGDAKDLEYREQLIDVFVRAIYLYDDKVIITYNYTGNEEHSNTIEKFGFNRGRSANIKI